MGLGREVGGGGGVMWTSTRLQFKKGVALRISTKLRGLYGTSNSAGCKTEQIAVTELLSQILRGVVRISLKVGIHQDNTSVFALHTVFKRSYTRGTNPF